MKFAENTGDKTSKSFQIYLPRAEWETLVYDLTHFDHEHQERIAAFFEKIDKDITIVRENNRDVIYSDRLDDNAILESLCNMKGWFYAI